MTRNNITNITNVIFSNSQF